MIRNRLTERQRRGIAWTIISSGVFLLLLSAVATPGAATLTQNQTNATYWDNSTYNASTVDNTSWTQGAEDPSIDNTTGYIARVGSFIVGSQRGSALGALLTSVLTGGIVVSIVGGTRPGVVAGATVGITTLGGMTAAGMAPQWVWALVIVGLGLVITQVLIRSLR